MCVERAGDSQLAMQQLRRTVFSLTRPSRLRAGLNIHLYHFKHLHYGRQSLLDTNRRHSGQRAVGTVSAFIPRITFFRVFWTVTTGTLGFVSYKLSGKYKCSDFFMNFYLEASNWIKDKSNLVVFSLLSLGLGILDSGSFLKEFASGFPTLSGLLPQPKSPLPPGDVAAAAALPLLSDEEEATEVTPTENDNFRHFIRRMIEIRDILKAADLENRIELPRIVVIGSQSSGKSSVLESIVGHEFLPKGQNMVTRRPLELTLVYSPDAPKDYGVFGGERGSGPIYDFSRIQQQLMDLNQAVPDTQWVSSDPVELTIYSRNVPDLTLVDLPGYIQISNKHQPLVLRERIAELCESYIQGSNNIVLAVCPADVDLANAEALKAAQRVDPHGERTVGVVTKLDLVDPQYATRLLQNEDYPLRLGYIGVVCKPVEEARVRFLRLGDTSRSQYERKYFAEHAESFVSLDRLLGIGSLRRVLTSTLEVNMAASLGGILHNVQEELDEVRYQLKVEFNDRLLTPEAYVSSIMTQLKTGFERVKAAFTRPAVAHQVDHLLQDHLVRVIEDHLTGLEPTDDPLVLEERLRLAIAALTRSGVGKLTVGGLAERLLGDLESHLGDGALSHHPQVKARLIEEFSSQLRMRTRVSADMIENALKPYKHEIEFTTAEWIEARQRLLALLSDQVKSMSGRIDAIQQEVGQRRLRKVIHYLASHQDTEFEEALSEKALGLLVKGKEVAELNQRMKRLQKRIDLITSDPICKTPTDGNPSSWVSWMTSLVSHSSTNAPITSTSCMKRCPEIYLFMLHERLEKVSSLFVHHELVHEFLDPVLPSLLLTRPDAETAGLAQGTVDRSTAMRYVAENPLVARHIRLLERRQALERVRDKLIYLRQRQEDK